jgi:NodT family efflux transporter outer membrane factor (OMF) lipoprotein
MTRFSLLIAVGISAGMSMVLTGCMVGPDFHRPGAAVSKDWMEARDTRVKSVSADYRTWWKAFNDPALDRLIDHAYRENLSLRIAGVRVLEARAQLGIAVGELYPQTQQAAGSWQYNRESEHGLLAQPPFHYSQSQIGVNAAWELDFWGKFRRMVQSADASWHATLADYDNALVSLTADVAGSYIAIRTLEKRIDIARQNAQTQQESLDIAMTRLKYGTVSQLDVEQARAVLNDTLAVIPSLEAQLGQAKHGLSILLGMAPNDLSDFLKGPAGIPVSPPQVIVGIPADLLRRRPDIRSAEYLAEAQSARIGAAKADLYPAFSLSGTFGFLSTDAGTNRLSDMFRWTSRTAQAGSSFQWSLFNYGRITNNVRLQDARLQELLINYQSTVLSAQQEVEDNLASFLKTQDQAAFLARSTESARYALDLAVMQYRQGIIDFTTVLTAQQALLREQDNLAVSMGAISSYLVGVYRALGGGWEIRKGGELLPPAVREEMAGRTDWGKLLQPASYNPPPGQERKSTLKLPDW